MNIDKAHFHINTSNGVNIQITVDNYFQDITFEIKLINFKKCVSGCHSDVKKLIEENVFHVSDMKSILTMILSVANDEMKSKLETIKFA